MVICVWSPELSESGNLFLGTKDLELFVNYTEKQYFRNTVCDFLTL